MILHQFKDYEEYLESQRRGSKRRPNRRPGAMPGQIDRIVDYWNSNRENDLSRGICHGARCGTEVNLLQHGFPGGKILGTDLCPIDKNTVIEWDFHLQKEEWVGVFDLIYTNSLDHSPKPEACLATWVRQLTPIGMLFVVWAHGCRLDNRPLPHPGGDCFGASLDEYIWLINKIIPVRDLLWCPSDYNQVVIVASQS